MGHFLAEQFPFEHEIKNAALYNTKEYLAQNETENLIRFSWLENGKVVVNCNLYAENNTLTNARYSSFGGIEYLKHSEFEIKNFLEALKDWASMNSYRWIVLKPPSEIYVSDKKELINKLFDSGFCISYSEHNQHIPIVTDTYKQVIKYNERKKLRRSLEHGFKFKKLSYNELPEAYSVICDTRIRNGFPVSMTLSSLQNMFNQFPNHYLLFGIYDAQRLIATAVSIKVTGQILYNFYHGDVKEYRSYSPIVMLLEGIYTYCQIQNISILDLGISSNKGLLNAGLFLFKENCGGIATKKNILTYKHGALLSSK